MATQLDHELAKLRQGDHLCPIHDKLVEQTASAVAFIAAGLRSGERCLYVANDSPFEELVRRFAALGVNVAQETALLPNPEIKPTFVSFRSVSF